MGCAEEGYPGAYTRTQCFLGFVAEQFGLKVAFNFYFKSAMIFYSRLTLPRPGRTPRGAQTAPTEPADELPESAFTSQFQSNSINDLLNNIREDF